MEALLVTCLALVTPKFVNPNWKITLLTAVILLSSVSGKETKFGQAAEVLNTASGIVAIERGSSNIQLSNSDIKTFKTMVRNLASIGLVFEPNEIHAKLSQADDIIKKLLSEGAFKLSIKPNYKDDKYQIPTRRITDNEGNKLKGFLEKMNTSGFEINIIPL